MQYVLKSTVQKAGFVWMFDQIKFEGLHNILI